MADPQTVAVCNKVLRAALAVKLAEREGIDLASKADPDADTYLSLVQFDLLGYPMGDSLLPLIQLNQSTSQDAGDEDEEEGITWLDQQIDDTKADLHDRLLNLSPQFNLEVSVLAGANPVLNQVYEEALLSASFAGAVAATSPATQKAREFLFPTDETGMSRKGDAYQLYESFEEDIREIDLAIGEASANGNHDELRRLQDRRARKHAEWLTLGRKREVEEAIRLVNSGDRDAGFEDERRRFLDLLEQRKVGRLISAKDYARVDMRPLEPLIDPEGTQHWRGVEITGAELPDLCTIKVRHLFGISLDDVEKATENVAAFQAEIATVMLIREWLSEEFLTARYWRSDGEMLSDGKGSGEIPTQATRALFVRNASYRIDGELSAERKQATAKAASVHLLPLFKAISTPLMTQLTLVKGNEKNGRGEAQLSALAQAKLTPHQLGRMQRLVQLKNPVQSLGQNATIKIGGTPRLSAIRPVAKSGKSGISPALRPGPQLMSRLGTAAILNSANLLKPKVRVREHRKKREEQQAKVRKLTQPMIRGKLRLGNAAVAEKKKPSIVRSGSIATGAMVSGDDFAVTYQRRDNGANIGPETAIDLVSDDENLFRFSLTVPPHFLVHKKLRGLTDIVLRLRGEHGQQLDEIVIPFTDDSSHRPIVWSIDRDVSLLEMTAPSHPVLFGYALELIPLAPNPDENLDWSGGI